MYLVQLTLCVQLTLIANHHYVNQIIHAQKPVAQTTKRMLTNLVSIVEAHAVCVVLAIHVCTVLVAHLVFASTVPANHLPAQMAS